MKNCIKCNIDFDDDKNFCINCGSKLFEIKKIKKKYTIIKFATDVFKILIIIFVIVSIIVFVA